MHALPPTEKPSDEYVNVEAIQQNNRVIYLWYAPKFTCHPVNSLPLQPYHCDQYRRLCCRPLGSNRIDGVCVVFGIFGSSVSFVVFQIERVSDETLFHLLDNDLDRRIWAGFDGKRFFSFLDLY